MDVGCLAAVLVSALVFDDEAATLERVDDTNGCLAVDLTFFCDGGVTRECAIGIVRTALKVGVD
jgi:hypothetical protein